MIILAMPCQERSNRFVIWGIFWQSAARCESKGDKSYCWFNRKKAIPNGEGNPHFSSGPPATEPLSKLNYRFLCAGVQLSPFKGKERKCIDHNAHPGHLHPGGEVGTAKQGQLSS